MARHSVIPNPLASKVPLVSCICPTMPSRRAKWFPQAVSCFVDQDYPNLELVVAADTEHVLVNMLEVMGRAVTTVCGQWKSLGEKRNAANAAAHGTIIVHWDDDDFSKPGRISHQVKRLTESNKKVTGFKSMKFVDESGNWFQYAGCHGGLLGSSLIYYKSWWEKHPFTDLQIGEDSAFVAAAIRDGAFLNGDEADFMYATIHSANTCKREPRNVHNRNSWKPLPNFTWR